MRDDEQSYEDYVLEREQDRARSFWRPATAAERAKLRRRELIGWTLAALFMVLVSVIGAR